MSTAYGGPALFSHEAAGQKASGVAWALLALSAAFLGLRLHTKYAGQRGFWWDDKLLVASWIIHLTACILLSVMVSMGFGRHPWDLAREVSTPITMARMTLTVTGAVWSKTAFAITILRLGEGRMRLPLWSIIVSLNIIAAVYAMMPWVGCHPVQKAWIPKMEGECLPASTDLGIAYASGVYSAICSFVLAFLPWPIIWKLRLPPKEKIGVGIAMSIGFAAGIMATIKTAFLSKLTTGDSYDAAHWSMLDNAEISVTIMAASVPALRVLFRDFSTATKRYYGGQGQNQRNSVVPNRDFSRYSSDREILGTDQNGKISRVDEIEVEYRNVSELDGFEMKPKKSMS
ncbi:hypothetical protein OQA88_9294 [Cercophora sp. LCS_1]